MPSLGSHLARAGEAADRLALPEIEADRGSFYLGATAPDIRVITRLDRRVTHFYELDVFEEQDSIARMFEENPHLARPAGLDAATVAFIAGYVTHLVLDERYIEEIYRELFGARSGMAEDPRRNVLDRALQYELDRRDRLDRERMTEASRTLAACVTEVDVPFIEGSHLVQWTEVAADVASHPPDYSRFRRMMARHLSDAGYAEQEIEACCDDPHALVREAFEVVGEDRIERFWRDATERITVRLWEYLR